MKKSFKITKNACYLGYVVQASVNNLMPLLFVFFEQSYKIPLYLISIIITYNFLLQILVDTVSAKITLKLGFKKTACLSLSLASLGLVLAGLTPYLFNDYISIYIGIMLSTTLMALGGGTLEVILNPVVEAVSAQEEMSAGMNILHSFYCVGHIGTVLFATLFFTLFGIENWSIFAFLLAILPLIDMLLFVKSPIQIPKGDEKPIKIKRLFKSSTFILIFIMMICAGASEMAVAQWVSYFAEKGLALEKSLGDVVGGCIFAFAMLLSRMVYGSKKRQVTLKVLLTFASCLAVCFLISNLLPVPLLSLIVLAGSGFFVGIMWPGIYAISGNIIQGGGTVMFSMMALGGDLGCALGPTLVGCVSEFSTIEVGMLSAIVFPIVMVVATITLIKKIRTKNKAEILN